MTTRLLIATAALSLIEPVIMIFMGIFVGFVLISLYLPIFSLAVQLQEANTMTEPFTQAPEC